MAQVLLIADWFSSFMCHIMEDDGYSNDCASMTTRGNEITSSFCSYSSYCLAVLHPHTIVVVRADQRTRNCGNSRKKVGTKWVGR